MSECVVPHLTFTALTYFTENAVLSENSPNGMGVTNFASRTRVWRPLAVEEFRAIDLCLQGVSKAYEYT